jgi:hypothetical protein
MIDLNKWNLVTKDIYGVNRLFPKSTEGYDLSKKYFFDDDTSKAIGYLPIEEFKKNVMFRSVSSSYFEEGFFTYLILDVNEKNYWHFVLEKTKVVELKYANTSDLLGII